MKKFWRGQAPMKNKTPAGEAEGRGERVVLEGKNSLILP